MAQMTTTRKIGIVLLIISLLMMVSIVGYAYYKSQVPDGKNLGEIMINWYIPEYDELIENSDLIVIATVTNKTGVWGTDDGEKPPVVTIYNNIYTEYTFKPEEVLKGNTTTVIGRVRGGEVDGYTQKATQTSSFEVGDKVILFLTNNTDSDGNRILWYYINWPGAFSETADGNFTNAVYGEISIEQLKQDIAESETV